MTTILPLQQSFPIVDPKTGFFSVYFKRYMDQLLARIGGITGSTYTALNIISGNVTWDFNSAPQAELTLPSGTTIINPPLNQVAGSVYKLTVVQPPSGANGLISFGDPPFRYPGGTPPLLSTANNAVDILWFYSDGTNIFLVLEALNQS